MGSQISVRVSRTSDSGMSLVELLVASAVLAIAIVAIVGIIRMGQMLNTTDSHRRQARAIIASQFESPTYSYQNFANLSSLSTKPDSVVEVDARGPLYGTLSVTIGPGASKTFGKSSVPYLPISMTVKWNEPAPLGMESVTFKKWLTQIQ